MRLYLFISLLLAGTVFGPKYCASQSKEDTLCFTVPQVRNLLIAAKQKTVLEERVIILSSRIDTLQSIIRSQDDKDEATVEGYKLELKVLQEEKKIYQDQVSTFEKMLRREKRKRFLTGLGGSLATAAALYLYITK
jgi:hypothetical protein